MTFFFSVFGQGFFADPNNVIFPPSFSFIVKGYFQAWKIEFQILFQGVYSFLSTNNPDRSMEVGPAIEFIEVW